MHGEEKGEGGRSGCSPGPAGVHKWARGRTGGADRRRGRAVAVDEEDEEGDNGGAPGPDPVSRKKRRTTTELPDLSEQRTGDGGCGLHGGEAMAERRSSSAWGERGSERRGGDGERRGVGEGSRRPSGGLIPSPTMTNGFGEATPLFRPRSREQGRGRAGGI